MSNATGYSSFHGSSDIEAFAKKVGFYAFNRFCRNQGISMNTALVVCRAVFTK